MHGDKTKGKEYYENGMLKFEGTYIFNKPENGEFYDESGKFVKSYIGHIY